jgi:hypothetical protein
MYSLPKVHADTLPQVEMPGEPKFKKFEEWQKKASVYYNSFKNAKVFLPFDVLCPA